MTTAKPLLDDALPIGSGPKSTTYDRRSPSQGRILWIDDDFNLTAAAHRRFRKRRIQMWSATDGMQGYWLALTRKPDVIITDLRMPRWHGRDLLDCLFENKVTCCVPVLVLSGYVTPEETRRLSRLGVAEVFEKPADWPRIFQTIKSLLNTD